MYCTTEADHNALISVQNSREMISNNELAVKQRRREYSRRGGQRLACLGNDAVLPNDERRASFHLFDATTIPGVP
jgi:hypothetical protein